MSFTWRAPEGRRAPADLAVASAPPALLAVSAVSSPAATVLTEQRQRAAGLLVDLFGYLDTHAERHPALAAVLPVMRSAVADYRAGTTLDPLAGPRAVYAAVQEVRRSVPALPDP